MVALIVVIVYLISVMNVPSGGTAQQPQQGDTMAKANSYVVYQEGGHTLSKNFTSDAIEFQSENTSAVIQATVDALNNSGGSIYIISGTYKITNEIVIYCKGINIFGDGPSTVLNSTTKTTVFMIKYPGKDPNMKPNHIHHLRIHGNSKSGAIVQEAFCWSYIYNLDIRYCRVAISVVNSPYGGVTTAMNLNDVKLTESFDRAITGAFVDCTWSNVLINGVTGGAGIYMHDSGRVLINQMQINTVHQQCIYLYYSCNVLFDNLYVVQDSQQTAYDCILISTGCKNISITGGYICGGGSSSRSIIHDEGENTIVTSVHLDNAQRGKYAITTGINGQYYHNTITGSNYELPIHDRANGARYGTLLTLSYVGIIGEGKENIHKLVEGTGYEQVITDGIVQPNYPRAIWINGQMTKSITIKLTGIDIIGNLVDEFIVVEPGTNGSISDTVFVKLNSFTIPAEVGRGEFISLGNSRVLGINDMLTIDSQVRWVMVNGIYITATILNNPGRIILPQINEGDNIIICYMSMDNIVDVT